uniref:Uncharacterized protein n=1 Tax=Bracon brevicornis TaxID=1563983 RepID=A0A6V7INC4_9HYME
MSMAERKPQQEDVSRITLFSDEEFNDDLNIEVNVEISLLLENLMQYDLPQKGISNLDDAIDNRTKNTSRNSPRFAGGNDNLLSADEPSRLEPSSQI